VDVKVTNGASQTKAATPMVSNTKTVAMVSHSIAALMSTFATQLKSTNARIFGKATKPKPFAPDPRGDVERNFHLFQHLPTQTSRWAAD